MDFLDPEHRPTEVTRRAKSIVKISLVPHDMVELKSPIGMFYICVPFMVDNPEVIERFQSFEYPTAYSIDEMRDLISSHPDFRKMIDQWEKWYSKCDCGADKTYGPTNTCHSHWCTKYVKC